MADMITRCPQCGTAFRITPAHLRSAKGSVRCGSCLHVFNARENLTSESQAVLARLDGAEPATDGYRTAATFEPNPEEASLNVEKPPSIPSPAPSPASSTQLAPPPAYLADAELDDLLISDDMEHNFGEDGAFPSENEEDVYVEAQPVSKPSLFERFEKDQQDDEEEDSGDDESWALKLLDEEDTAPAERDAEALEASANENATTIDEDELADQESWDEGISPADDEDENSSIWFEHATPASGTTAIEDQDGMAYEAIVANRQDMGGSAYLDAIEPEPVEFSYREEKSFWQSRLLWSGLCLLASLALIGQIAWMQYPALNRTEPYRSFYAIACDLLGCELPPQLEPSAIRRSNLVVRSHPRQEGALMVDLVLQNTASFEQPFPVLELIFSDLQGNTVAQRRFEPEEYLGGEMTGEREMPVRQPVHIALEIVDPGPQALNYRVDIIADP